MQTVSFTLLTLQDTIDFGNYLGSTAKPGEIICLDGDLGSGKTTLTQSIASGLSISPEVYVSSPSFSLLHEYPGEIPLYHMDLYRLNSEDEVIESGLDEYFYLSGLTVIEWSEKAQDLYPDNSLKIKIQIAEKFKRSVTCQYKKEYWHDRLQYYLSKYN